ncbi:MAG TPA: YhdP family protein [Limnobacter sp.]|nr:YhdP family protein [Limnobacter sp.]
MQIRNALGNQVPKRIAHGLFWLLIAVYVPVCVALLAIKWWVLPDIDRYRPQIQSFIQRQANLPIELGRIEASWQGLGPQLLIHQVSLPQPSGEPGFKADKLRLDVSLPSLLAFSPRLGNLEVHAPVISLVRTSSGVVEVAGIPIVDDGTKGNPGLDWLLHQKRILLKNGRADWKDETGQFPSAQVTDVELLMENSLGRHQAGLQLRLPMLSQTPLDAALDFRTPLLQGRLGDIARWKGTAYMHAQLDQFSPLQSAFESLGLNIAVNQPEGRFWLDFDEGLVQRSLLQASVARLSFSNAASQAEPFVLTNTSALVELSGGHALLQPDSIALHQLAGQIAGQKQFGPTDLALGRQKLDSGTEWSIQALNLDAAQARELAIRLAPHVGQQASAALLQSSELAGQIKRMSLSWTTAGEVPHENPVSFKSDVDFQHLTALYRAPTGNPEGRVTGFRNVSGRFSGSDNQGEWALSGESSAVSLPEVFAAESLEFESIQGKGQWRDLFTADRPAEFIVQDMQASNSDLQAQVAGVYRFHRDESDFIDIKGKLMRAELARVSGYLPLVIGASARDWMAENLKAGMARDGQFELSGRLADFPFDKASRPGVFKIEVPFSNGELTYAPGWPGIRQVNGKVTINGKSMQIQAGSAESLGVNLRNVQARIDNLDAWEPMLEIKGQGQGELGRMVAFVNQSPVREILNEALVNAEVAGNASLDLRLSIPIADPEQTQVKGGLMLKGNSIRVVRGMPTVSNIDGLIQFSNQGLFIDQLQGQALGGPVQVKGTTDSAGRMEIRASGIAKSRGIAQYLNPLVEPYLDGSTNYTVLVATQDEGISVDVSSQLQGLQVKLPEPFEKKADLRLAFKLNQTSSAQGERWQVDLGPDGKPVAQLRALVLQQNGQPGIDSMQFSVGAPLAPPATGIQGDIRVPLIDVDTWRSIFSEITSTASNPSNAGLMGSFLADPTTAPALRMKVAVTAGRLNMGSKSFEGVSVAARTVEKRWQFDLKARGVDGYLTWVADPQRPEGAVLARFKTLTIPKTLDSDMRDLVEEPASSIPALDVMVDNFTLNDIPLGKLKLIAVNQARDEQARAVMAGRPKEWKLQELRIENPESVTSAKGVWQYGENLQTQRTDIDVDQTVKNAGGLLTRLGMAGVFQGGEGSLTGRLRWNDAPTNIDYGSLSGQFKLKSSKGQFLKADPGVAKLLGVLSLQSIPRRLTLDFKDVFSEGFAYDSMDADVVLKEGVASTQNFKMTGPSATVLMDGKLDLESETQNLNVVVLPDLNPTGGSLIYSLMAANPAVGIASLIADFVFKDPLSKIFSFQYKVSGPWTAPLIERVRKNEVQEVPTNPVNSRP